MSTTRMIARVALVAAALSTAGAATVAVTLPSKANHHAVTATANVTTGATNGKSDSVHPASTPSPNDHASFGMCVSDNAQAGTDVNPTTGCTNANANAGSETTGAANATVHANANSSRGREESTEKSANGAENASATGATHIAAH